MVAALLAAAIVARSRSTSGRRCARKAEDAGSKYIERPLHIGALKIHLLTGKVLVENLTIDGLHPGDRPFFTARSRSRSRSTGCRRSALRPDITDQLGRDDRLADAGREMGRRAQFPALQPRRRQAAGPEADDDDAQVRCARSAASSPSKITRRRGASICRNLDINIGNLPNYHGTATFNGGTVAIQDFVPMWANMKAQFVIDGRAHSSRSRSTWRPTARRRWPAATSTWRTGRTRATRCSRACNFPRMRELFFKDETWRLAGDGDFTGTFRLFKTGERPTAISTGTFASELAGRERLSVSVALRLAALDAARLRRLGRRLAVLRRRREVRLRHQAVRRRRRKPTHHFDATLTGVDLARFTDFEQFPGPALRRHARRCTTCSTGRRAVSPNIAARAR